MKRYTSHFLLPLVLFLGLYTPGFGQKRTVGLLQYSEEVNDGYTLFTPLGGTTVYLIDNCGAKVHKWVTDYPPGNACYLQPDGTLFRAGRLLTGPIFAGGAGGIIQQLTWDGEVIWEFEYNNDTVRAHHDFHVMPNGNILVLAWEAHSREEAEALGMDPARLDSGVHELWPEQVIEIDPSDDNRIVWKWSMWDHLIQDFDSTKSNYGDVSSHPEKIDINFTRPDRTKEDWVHANALNYNPELDQIMISAVYLDEVWIIDHSTTTEEAAGPAGDLLFRWGNPRGYKKGTFDDQQLFGQHDTKWIPAGMPNEGKILIFNNGLLRFDNPDLLYSSVVMLDVNPLGNVYEKDEQGRFLPETFYFEYTDPNPPNFYSRFISGAQQQPNGNILINSGAKGTLFEINEQKEIIWKYVSPVTRDNGIADQGENVAAPNNGGRNPVWRAERYPPDFPAFVGRNLSSRETIEPGNDFIVCNPLSLPANAIIYPNPTTDVLIIESYKGEYLLSNIEGKIVAAGNIDSKFSIDLTAQPKGLYFLRMGSKSFKVMLQ